MDDAKLKLNCPALLAVPRQHADRLLESGDGDAALLYLHILKNGGALDVSRAAAELRLSPRRIENLAMRLEGMGLLSEGDAKPLPDREPPEYRAADVVRRSRSDPAFQALVEETQTTLGRVLSSTDLKKLFGIYDDLGLPADVIMLLIHHCKQEHDRRYGAEKHLGFSVIEREAYAWFDRELMTYEQAEGWLEEQEKRRSLAGEIQRAMGIRDRELSPTERKYLAAWMDMGFGPEALALAADRTVTNTGALKWKYMDSIVNSWHKKGLHTVPEIEKGDRKTPAGRKSAAATAPDAGELERMRKIREKLTNS